MAAFLSHQTGLDFSIPGAHPPVGRGTERGDGREGRGRVGGDRRQREKREREMVERG